MEGSKEGNNSGSWMSVPAFGDWDMQHGVPDYSLDFSKIREMRKQNKSDFSRISVGNEEELKSNHKRASQDEAPEARNSHRVVHHDEDDHSHQPHSSSNSSPTTRKKFMRYFHCCMGA